MEIGAGVTNVSVFANGVLTGLDALAASTPGFATLPGPARAWTVGSGVAELAGQVRAVVNEDMEGLALDGRAVEFPAPEVYVDTIAFNAVAWAGNDAGDGSGENRLPARASCIASASDGSMSRTFSTSRIQREVIHANGQVGSK